MNPPTSQLLSQKKSTNKDMFWFLSLERDEVAATLKLNEIKLLTVAFTDEDIHFARQPKILVIRPSPWPF
jgi:hypothetical protein